MKERLFAIIEIGSNNTKTHIYSGNQLIFENNITIQFKKNYQDNNTISKNDLKLLYKVIEKALEYTGNLNIYGCSIFRDITKSELDEINGDLKDKYNIELEVVSQDREALFTAFGCYDDVEYAGNICIFIGGGGSIEIIFVNNHQVIDKRYYDFGVIDITKKFNTLRDDIPSCTFDEVYSYISDLVGNFDIKADVLILAGGDHLYWYNNAQYRLSENTLYNSKNQKYVLTKELSDKYDRDALVTSLNKIKARSDNPLWFDQSRAMKVLTNVISCKVEAKYIVPTKINMEDGLRGLILESNEKSFISN